MKPIGFIGLGTMGYPMAARLHAAGHSLIVRDAVDATQQRFVAEFDGVSGASDLAAFDGCETIVTMLPNSDIVDAIVTELAPLLAADALVIDMSSSDPVRTRALAATLRAVGKRLIDAPVSGGVARARTGTLAIMVGGDAVDLDAARDLLATMGSTITHVGAVGAGHAVKALNNYVSAAGLIATAEALLVAEQFGIDPDVVVDVFNASTGKNNTTEMKAKQYMLSGAFDSGFSLALMAKDVGIAASLGAAVGTPMALGAQVSGMCTAASEALGVKADHTEVYRYVRESS
jgi:3-hydroxyisobutyrate dehydrogenase